MQKALDFLRPHRPHRLYPLCFVAETTRNNAKRIFELLGQDNELSPADLEEARKLLDDSPKADGRDILNVVNWDGFTLLQRAVIGNQLAFIKLLIKKGVDVNAGICSLPPASCLQTGSCTCCSITSFIWIKGGFRKYRLFSGTA